jgi:hypothetical protein
VVVRLRLRVCVLLHVVLGLHTSQRGKCQRHTSATLERPDRWRRGAPCVSLLGIGQPTHHETSAHMVVARLRIACKPHAARVNVTHSVPVQTRRLAAARLARSRCAGVRRRPHAARHMSDDVP